MRIQVIDAPIPEGYTYIRTDRFTAQEFVQEVKAGQREAARAWMRAHPRETYTLEDVRSFRDARAPGQRKARRGEYGRPVVSSAADGICISGRTSKRYGSADERY